MRLTLKLTLAFTLIMAFLLLIHGFLVVEREVELFEKDMENHANIVGNAILALVPEYLHLGGKIELVDLIKRVNEAEPFLHIRLVDIRESSFDLARLHINDSALTVLRTGQRTMNRAKDEKGQEYLYAYFPISIRNSYFFAIEIAESLKPMRQYINNTIFRKIILFMAVVLAGGILVLLLGAGMVGNPVNNMVQLTTRVSNDDFSGNVKVKNKKDELAKLAAGLNNMVANLRQSRQRLEEETAHKIRAIEQLQHAERLTTVGKLASGLAHELGTPLNVVSGRAKMISSGQLNPDEVSESAVIIDEQSDKMTKLIRRLLDFSRQRSPEKRPTAPGEIVSKVISLLKPLASTKKIELNITLPELLPVINMDPGQIQQVITNLIMNAIHAMPDGGEIRTFIRQEKMMPPADIGSVVGDYICAEIIDEGVGIPDENLSQIFTPFFTTKDVGKGTGLGLSIAYGIVRDHKGWIAVSSQPGKGSVFSVYLPVEDK